jgi:hypothetical protein
MAITPSMLRYAMLATLAAALLIAGCGSGSKDPSGSAGGPSKAGIGIAFAKCMRSHGVPNFPDPSASNGGGLQIQASQRSGSGQTMTVDGVPVNAPAFQSAMQACQSDLPRGGKGPPGGIAGVRQKALKFSQCMRSHGVPNFPDPQVSSGPGGGIGVRIGGPGSGLDPSAPAFKSAQQSCGSFIGGAFGRQSPS